MKRSFVVAVVAVLAGAGLVQSIRAATPLAANTWSAAADMTTGRAGASATLLPAGDVIVAGGVTDAGVTASAEIYTPSINAFSVLPPMAAARANHTATLLADGRVLVAGGTGTDGRALASAEIFDPATGGWVASGAMSCARSGHTATLLPDGRVVVAGGDDAGVPTASIEIFDPATAAFSLADASLTSARTGHAAALVDGAVMISGGFDGTGVIGSVDLFDFRANAVTAGPLLGTARAGHTATTLLNGKVLVAGGAGAAGELSSAELFDPASNTIAPAGALANARQHHAAALLPNNNTVLFVGGTANGKAVPSAELYVPWETDGGAFVPAAVPSTARAWPIAAALGFAATDTIRTGPADGVFLLAGGSAASDASSPLRSSEVYGFATVNTDRSDYAPGTTVTITGGGWQPGEWVTLMLKESPDLDDHPLLPVQADANGRIVSTEFQPDSHDIDVRFFLTAFGSLSQAQTTFSDAANTTQTVVSCTPNPVSTGATTTCTATVTDVANPPAQSAPAGQVSFSAAVGTFSATPPKCTLGNPSGHSSSCSLTYTAPATGQTVSISATAQLDATWRNSTGSTNLVVQGQIATTLSVAPASGAFGGTTTLSATLTANGSGVSGRSIVFTLNGNAAGSATTNQQGVATLGNASLSGINAGAYTAGVAASFAGDPSYLSSAGTAALSVNKADQAITVTTAAPSSAVYGTNFTVAATGGASGNPVTFSSAGACSNTGATFTMTSGTGTCTVKIDQAGNLNYNAAPEVTESVTARKADQTITVTTPAPPTAVYNTSFTVVATGGASDSLLSFASSGVCSNSGATFTMTSGTGTCTVKIDQAGNDNYNAAPEVTASVTAQKANQSITVTTPAPGTAVYNTSFTVAATGGASGSPVTFSAGGVCNNVGATFTMTSGTGTCTVKFDQAGNDNYNAAPEITESVAAQKASQTINVTTPAPPTAIYNTKFTVVATGGASGNPLVFASSGACSNSDAVFTMTSGTGACTVKIDQAGNDNYNAAPEVTESVTAQKADQAINVATPAPSTAVYNDSFTVVATGGASNNPVTYSASGVCTNVGATFKMTSGTGTCTVMFDQAGNDNYNAAPEVTESVTAQKADQAINVATPAPPTAVYNDSFTVAATGGASNNPVTYSASGVCTNVGATFKMTSGTGTCTVMFDQAGNDNYNAAPEVTESVTAQKANQSITVATPAPATAVYNTSFTVAATGGASNNPLTYSASGVCTNVGATFKMTSGTGTCTVMFDQAGDLNYNAAPQVTESVTAQKANQSISFAPLPAKTLGDPDFTVTATASSGLGVTFTAAGACTVTAGGLVHITGIGACTVTATQAGNDNYNPAAASQKFTIGYNVCVLFDQSRSYKQGSTVPIKLYLCTSSGVDVSSSGVVVTATQVMLTSMTTPAVLDDSGNANPDFNFRFDATLGPSGGYIFNVSTKPLGGGTYNLYFTTSAEDPAAPAHSVVFSVR